MTLFLQPCHDLRSNSNWLLETKCTKLPKYFNQQYEQFHKSHNFHSTGKEFHIPGKNSGGSV